MTTNRPRHPIARDPGSPTSGGRLFLCLALAVGALAAALPTTLPAQTIEGTLMDLETDQPIDLGLVLMFTEEGDSVDMTVSDERGSFTLTSPEPGTFLLLASALGYEETRAGLFELGSGSSMTIEYRLEPQPLAMREITVSLDRPVLEHRLVRNGFVRRLQRGLGAFVTPHEIENSPASTTEDLLLDIPGVRVADVRVTRGAGDTTVVIPRSDLGQTVQLRSFQGGWCTPTLYVDGSRSFYETSSATSGSVVTLSTIVPLAAVEAVEVYRRPAEIPMEYSSFTIGGSAALGSGRATDAACGVILVWTNIGPRTADPRRPWAGGDATGNPVVAEEIRTSAARPDPEDERAEPPSAGERIRMLLAPEMVTRFGVSSPWEGMYLEVREGRVVGTAPVGGTIAVPVEGVEALQVLRERSWSRAVLRGSLAGTAIGVGMWQFMKLLCASYCDENPESVLIPAAATGIGVGVLVGSQGPGTRWVDTRLPDSAPPPRPSRRQDPGPSRD